MTSVRGVLMKGRLSWALALLLTASVRPCQAQSAQEPAETFTAGVQRCVRDHERAAVLRSDQRWLEARVAMTQCASEVCPMTIRSDCSAWLDDVAKLMPSVLVVIERDDSGGPPVRLEVEGRTLELAEPTAPIELVPGSHRLRFVLASYAPIERDVVLARGEKNQVLRIRFARPKAAKASVPKAGSPPPVRHWRRPVQVSTYVLGGGAIAAFATSGALLMSALKLRDEVAAECAPNCSSDQVKPVRLRLLQADVSGGIGIVLTGAAIYTFVTRPRVPEARQATAGDGVAPVGSASLLPALSVETYGATLSVVGRF
jgi:hypothetical protein